MKFIIKNTVRFLKNETLIFMVILICVLCSSLILNFSYGLYQNYHVKKNEYELETHKIVPAIAEGCTLTKGELKNYSLALGQDTLDAMEVIYGMASISDFDPEKNGPMYMRYTIRNGQFQICETTKNAFEKQGQIIWGRYITNEEEAVGANVVLLPTASDEQLYQSLMTDDTTIRLFGKNYEVIGKYNGAGGCPIVPFLTVPDSIPLDGFGIRFYKSVTKTQYNQIVNTANELLPGKLIFEDLHLPDNDTIYLYNNTMLIAVLISVVSAINFAMLYLYMVKRRSHELSVFRICGCTKSKAVRLYLGECILISVPVYFVGVALYIILLKRLLSDVFEYMEQAYSVKIYLIIFLIYLAVVLLIMEIVIRKKISSSVMEGLRGGRNG